jgi:succinyl-diaminopimelate desuccinylase
MVVTRVWTENSANVVPEKVMLNVNIRFAPGRTADDAIGELRTLVGEDGSIDVTDAAPSGAVYLDHPLIEPWRQKNGLPVAPKQAWTDVARFTERGIPAVNFGPGETAQAHQSGEWCSIDSLVHAYRNLYAFFTEPLRSAAP